MKRWFRELSGYGVASIAALSADMLVLWLLVHFLEWSAVTAATVSFLGGATVAYWLSVRIAFKQHVLRDRRFEFLCFVAIGIGGLAINALIIGLAVDRLGMHYLFAKCLAAGFTFTFNFLARRQILFARAAHG